MRSGYLNLGPENIHIKNCLEVFLCTCNFRKIYNCHIILSLFLIHSEIGLKVDKSSYSITLGNHFRELDLKFALQNRKKAKYSIHGKLAANLIQKYFGTAHNH